MSQPTSKIDFNTEPAACLIQCKPGIRFPHALPLAMIFMTLVMVKYGKTTVFTRKDLCYNRLGSTKFILQS